jgi:glycosyltransferase involved in cell wall biosynthesis
MSLAAFPEGNPFARGKLSAVSDTRTGTGRQPPLPGAHQYRPVGAAFAIAPTVSVVIPVKNEARNLPIVFRSVPGWVDEVVLVDGRSVDDTVAVARQCRPDIKIVHQTAAGKGDALLAGFAACTGDIIVMIDGDGSTDGGEIISFVAALVAGADFAKGSRFSSSGGSDDINLARRLGNRVLCGFVNLAFGTRYTDLCYGYNAFWSRHLPTLDLDCMGFEIETMMNIRAAKVGLRIQEIPSHEFRRVHGVSNLRVIFDGWRILKVIVTEALSRHPRQPRGRRAVTPPEAELPLPAVAVAADVSKD